MADQNSPIQQVAAGSNAVDRFNENFDAASPAMLWGRDARTSGGLTWGYIGGRWGSSVIANGTLDLTASATNYVVAERATGAVTASTTTTNWADQSAYVRLYLVITGASTVTDYEDHRQLYMSSSYGGSTPVVIPVACSDETTSLTTGAAKVTFRIPLAITLTEVRASLTTAQSSGSTLTVDINAAGVSILSTKLTIDNTEKTSKTAATPPVISTAVLADDAEITVDIDQIGASGATGLKVYLVGVPQ